MCRGESSCILPIAPAAVHTDATGSRQAIIHFTEYLERFPDDLDIRWLLNLAHMTLGEYPDKVDPRYLVSIDRFIKSEFDIGKFSDIGDLAKVNRFNMAGGGVMEDFDNDGLLDLATTSFDPTMPMGLYRNSGDGTFTETTEAAGSARSARRQELWFRPISTTMGIWIYSSHAGRGSTLRSARVSCATTATAPSPT